MTKNHFEALDGLRGVAALAVVIFHRRWWAPHTVHLDHAYLAVDFFFLLSGFVIAHAYQDRLRAGMTLVQFVRLRLVRLGPMLIAGGLLGASFVLAKTLGGRRPLDTASVTAIVATLFALPSPLPMWLDPANAFPINGPSWSLFFEICINLLFGILALHLTTKRLTALIVASFGWLIYAATASGGVAHLGHTYSEFVGGVPRVSSSFLLGVLMYRIIRSGRLPRPELRGGLWTLGVLLLATFIPSKHLPWNVPYELMCIALVFPAIVWLGASINTGGRTAAFARFGGELSYPIYIVHYPLYFWIEAVTGGGGLWLLVASVLLIAAVSHAALVLIDRPLRNLASKGRPPARSAASISGASPL